RRTPCSVDAGFRETQGRRERVNDYPPGRDLGRAAVISGPSPHEGGRATRCRGSGGTATPSRTSRGGPPHGAGQTARYEKVARCRATWLVRRLARSRAARARDLPAG